MGISGFSKQTPGLQSQVTGPYQDSAINLIYQMLFCDDISLFKTNAKTPLQYPYDVLFNDKATVEEIQSLVDDMGNDPRVQMLACNQQMAMGHKPAQKELYAVIVEVSMEEGLDVLASFKNGTARYINHTEKLIIWENTTDKTAHDLKDNLFLKSKTIVDQIGPWDKPRKKAPVKGNVRISFLVSDGLYFGEGPINVLFNDAMGAPALDAATRLMQYLTQQDLSNRK